MRFSRFTLGLLLCALAPQVGAAQGNQEQGSVAGEESTPSVEPSIAVLSIYSEEGDDDAAAKITAALRISIQQLGMGQLDSREVSLAQMSLAHGCATPDSQCMTKVADALKVDRVFYGTLHRRSESEGFLLSLRYFDRDIGAVVGSMEDELAPADLEGSAIETRAERYAAELAGILRTGTLRIVVDVPKALVKVDGSPAGSADDDGVFETQLEPGDHTLEVVAPDRADYAGTVSITVGSRSTVEVSMKQASEEAVVIDTNVDEAGSWVPWVGWGLVALGVGGAALGIISALRVGSLEDDPTFAAYRRTVPMGRDACTEARQGESFTFTVAEVSRTAEVCDEADVFQILQWVGFGVAGAALTSGVLVLLFGENDGTSDSPAAFLQPTVTSTRATLDLHLRF